MTALVVLAHHSEPSDPQLLRWIIDTFEAMLGLGPTAVIVPVGTFVVAFPVALALLALRSRRAQVGRERRDEPEAAEADGGGDGRLAR